MVMRVCIPTAGTGSRLKGLTKYVNKSLVGLDNRPILSHLIEQFPPDAEFVIALGHKGHLVRDFLELAYPNRTFLYSQVDPFEGEGSGLGLSLLKCKEHLQQPFIFISCDTLVREPIPPPEKNWMGYAEVDDLTQYRTMLVEKGAVVDICEKTLGRIPTHKAYIGLAGIKDYEIFWKAMEEGGKQAIDSGEAHGQRAFIGRGIDAHAFTWFDTGNPPALEKARTAYEKSGGPNILEKTNEAIWFVDGQVIKFSDDQTFIANRAKRAALLKGFVPEITGVKSNMYRYAEVEGRVMSDVVTVPLFEKLLQHCQTFWSEEPKSDQDKVSFKNGCMKFYKDKTFERVDLFFKNFEKKDGTESINGVSMPTVKTVLDNLDWNWIADGLPRRFHGDLHFENILWSGKKQVFTFLDWRQDFAGSLTTGDVYYDLAKLMHGLIVCHELIAQDMYQVKWEDKAIHFDLHRKQMLVECERFFESWIVKNGYDLAKVRTLTALIYLNIAALHHYPYSLLLFGLGKSMLANEKK